MPDEPKNESAKRSGLKGLAQAESMLQIAMAVPAGVCVGLGIGYLLDRHFHQHWMTVTLMLLGAAGGFVQIFTVGLRSTGDSKAGNDRSANDKAGDDDK